MKAACAGDRQDAKPNASSSMKKFFTASQIAHPPRRIQGKWERAMKRPKANFNQTIETKLSFSTCFRHNHRHTRTVFLYEKHCHRDFAHGRNRIGHVLPASAKTNRANAGAACHQPKAIEGKGGSR